MSHLRLVSSTMTEPERSVDGFVAIPNAIFDALLVADLSSRQLKIAMAIVRKTLGYGKRVDDVTIQQLANVSGLGRNNASPAFHDLIGMKIVSASKGRHGLIVSINDPEMWDLTPSKIETKTKTNVSKLDGRTSQNETHNIQLQKTIEEPPVVPQSSKPSRKQSAVALQTWLDAKNAAGEKPIPEADPVFAYAEQAHIPLDYLRLCWLEFRARSIASGKRYADWRAAFRNCVRADWYRLWAFDREGSPYLTTSGKQAAAAHGVGE